MTEQSKTEQIEAYLEIEEKAKYLRPKQVGPLAAGLPGFGDEKIEELGNEQMWVPDNDLGFALAEVTTKKDTTWEVVYRNENNEQIRGEFPVEQLQEVNPKAFQLSENMASLTHLNEASVLFNLRDRFSLNLIHTYSGLFCVTINPWRWLPIYTKELIDLYCGHADSRPPHVYQVANTAYSNVCEGAGNQSILITGESGAGKTENTKKIIQYFTVVAGRPREEGEASLEDQIVEMNPVLEAFGNAKTVKNDNSSRFGKFIRIRFGLDSKVNGADVQSYLLEKSRVVSQNPNERNYHIFYQMLSPHGLDKETKEQLKIKLTADDYRFSSQGDATKVRGMDDSQEMKHTHKAMKLLGFDDKECCDIYQLTYAVLLIGQMKFVQQEGANQTFIDGYEEANAVCEVLGLSRPKFIDSITDPTFMVGGEVMTKYLDYKATMFCVAAFAKVIYQKIFDLIIKRCNKCLNEKHQKNQGEIQTEQEDGAMFRKGKRKGDLFIGVLDIAGFEIMPDAFGFINSFEQLCINFTNEKLQQFFNHYMFIREQKEYEQEHIEWEKIDFGFDLEQAISLLEKPMGVLSMLEEEGMVPNGSDAEFVAKLLRQHQNKTPKFKRPKISRKTQIEAHFAIEHYAGTVPYVVDGWLDKNKDPLNDCLIELVKTSASNDLLRTLFGGPANIKDVVAVKAKGGKGGKKKSGKSSSLMTTTVVHKAQLNDLLATLNRTSPHFVRCIVPNYGKEPGWLNGPLVLHQLQCNGVLEGIRICRRGYPSRLLFRDFCERYQLFAADMVKSEIEVDLRRCCGKLAEALELEHIDQYQLGVTKIFLRVGIIGTLESRRMARISYCLVGLQSYMRMWCAEVDRKRRMFQNAAREILQRVFHNWVKSVWDYQRRVMPWKRLVDLTKEIDLNWSEEDWEVAMAALEGASDGDGGKWEQGEWVPGKMIDGKFLPHKPKERALRPSARKGMVDSEEMEKMKEENEKLKMEVEYLTAKVEEVTVVCEKKDVEISEAKEELTKQDTAMVELKQNVKEQEDNIKVLYENLTVEKVVLKEMENKTSSLVGEIEKVRENLRLEKKAKEQVEVEERQAKRLLEDQKFEIRKMEDQKRAAEQVASEKEQEVKTLEAKLAAYVQKLEQSESNSKDFNARLNAIQQNLEEEKGTRKKLEKVKETLTEEKRDYQQQLREMDKKIDKQHNDIRHKTEELTRLNKQMVDAKQQFELVITDLKGRHQKAYTALQNEKEAIQREKIRLEMENKQLRGQLEAERTDKLERSNSGYFGYDRGYDSDIIGNPSTVFGKRKLSDRMPSNRMSFRSYSGQSQSSIDEPQKDVTTIGASKSVGNMMSKRLEDLEKDNQRLEDDKRKIVRELNKIKADFNDEKDEKEVLARNLRQVRHDADKMSNDLAKQEERTMELERSLHRANNDIMAWKTKFEGLSLEKQNEIEREKKLMRQKLEEASEQERNKSQQVNSMEKSRGELLSELNEVNAELERTYTAMSELEKLQKTQDKALDHWGTQYRHTQTELEALREENNKLRTKLRQQAKEIESIKEVCKGQGLPLGERASLLESDIRSLRSEIETSKPFSSTLENGHSSSANSYHTRDFDSSSPSTARNGYDDFATERRRRSISRERSPADHSASLSFSSNYTPSTKPADDTTVLEKADQLECSENPLQIDSSDSNNETATSSYEADVSAISETFNHETFSDHAAAMEDVTGLSTIKEDGDETPETQDVTVFTEVTTPSEVEEDKADREEAPADNDEQNKALDGTNLEAEELKVFEEETSTVEPAVAASDPTNALETTLPVSVENTISETVMDLNSQLESSDGQELAAEADTAKPLDSAKEDDVANDENPSSDLPATTTLAGWGGGGDFWTS